MSKISELSDGTPLVSSDYLIAVRSGGNVKVRLTSLNIDQVTLGDNEMIRLGNSQDLTMVHTSTQSIINQAGIGDLLLQKAGTTKASITANGLEFPDNSKAIFGAGSDLQIYHSGTNSYIADSGTGSLYVQGSSNILLGSTTQSNLIIADGGAVTARYAGDNKLATTATGIDVIGNLTTTGAATAAGIIASDNTSQSVSIGINDGAGYINSKSAAGGVMPLAFYTGGTEKARIDSSGNLLVGVSTFANNTLGVAIRGASGGATDESIRCAVPSTSSTLQIGFYNANGRVGSVSTSGSATAYTTSSDQRLKENIADADNAGSKIDAIQVRKFDWKVDGSHQDYGMVAQELQAVAPEAVSAPEDPEEMMGVDYSKLVPMMLKEIQSLRARIAALES